MNAQSELILVNLFDYIFVVCAVAFNWLIVGIFIATKRARTEWRKRFGVIFVSLGIPFAIVFVDYLFNGHDLRTRVWFGFVLLYIAIEFLLDYVLKMDFRQKPISHIPYIVLEYIALFSLLGIAFSIDRACGWIVALSFWAVIASLIYLY